MGTFNYLDISERFCFFHGRSPSRCLCWCLHANFVIFVIFSNRRFSRFSSWSFCPRDGSNRASFSLFFAASDFLFRKLLPPITSLFKSDIFYQKSEKNKKIIIFVQFSN